MRRLLAASFTTVGLACLPIAVADAGAPVDGPPVITPPLAAIVDDFWPRREAALVARNPAAVDALETDAAAVLDHAWIMGANAGLDAGMPRTVTGRYVLVPR